MLKLILPLYTICLALYIFFTRQPDYQDGEFTPGVIHFIIDSTHKKIPVATFEISNMHYKVDASYPLRKLTENEPVTVIYDTSDLHKAAVYACWGYWLRWNEILGSFIGIIILYFVAASITHNPEDQHDSQ